MDEAEGVSRTLYVILHTCIHIYSTYMYKAHVCMYVCMYYTHMCFICHSTEGGLYNTNQEPLKDFISRGTLSDLCLIKNALLSWLCHGLRKTALEASSKRFFLVV